MKYYVYTFVLLVALASCKKEEGFGGQTTIKGKITERIYDESFKIWQREVPATKEDVFLVMGNDSYFGEKLETGNDGTFEVKYLQPGDYSIYYYSEDSATGVSGNKISFVKKFSISRGQKNVDLGTLVKYSTIKYNKGRITIKGIVVEKAYDETYKTLQYEETAADEDLYLVVGDGTTFSDRIRTSSDGTFEIKNLQLGTFSVYVYSEDTLSKIPGKKVTQTRSFTLTSKDTLVDLGYITKFKTLKYDEGNSTITGFIKVNYFNTDFTVLKEKAPAQNEDVFLVYGNNPYNEDRIRTMYNGSYAFPNLIKGIYKVYVLSDNPTGSSKKITFSKAALTFLTINIF